jgi:hypothetical protein
MKGEEKDTPPEIEEKLDNIDGKGSAALGCGGFAPNKEARNSHHYI